MFANLHHKKKKKKKRRKKSPINFIVNVKISLSRAQDLLEGFHQFSSFNRKKQPVNGGLADLAANAHGICALEIFFAKKISCS